MENQESERYQKIRETSQSFPEIAKILEKKNYTLVQSIGHGGFGDVFLIHSSTYNMEFVLKQLKMEKVNQNTIREVELMINVCHPNIVSIYDYFYENDVLYLVLEYCPGGNLFKRIEESGIPHPKLLNYCNQILKAVAHCHSRHIAHRDLKPGNILLDHYDRIKLSDFGLSTLAKPGELIHEFSGTSVFMAPELQVHHDYDPFAADIWALGITFYIMASGRLPWTIHNRNEAKNCIINGVIEVAPNINPQMMHLIRKMTDVNPRDRPTANDLLKYPIFKSVDVQQSFKSNRIIRTRVISKAGSMDQRSFHLIRPLNPQLTFREILS